MNRSAADMATGSYRNDNMRAGEILLRHSLARRLAGMPRLFSLRRIIPNLSKNQLGNRALN